MGFALACGCTPKKPEPPSLLKTHQIVVRDFGTENAEVHRLHSDVVLADVGHQLAETIAATAKDYQVWDNEGNHVGPGVRVDSAASPATGQLIIEGDIRYFDGGNRAARIGMNIIFGMIPSGDVGGVEVWVRGRVLDEDGSVLHEFDTGEDYSGNLFTGGGSYEGLLQALFDTIAWEIVDAIDQRRFTRLPSRPAVETPRPRQEPATVEQRLRDLEDLKREGVISEAEYESQRARIISEL